MPISIYPPTLQSSQPAFLYNVTEYPIYFSLQKITSFQDIGHIQIRVVRQTNNRSVINTNIYPDGIIYKSPSEITKDGHKYSINILRSELIEPWQQGQLYKVQMRFGVNAKYEDKSQFATWKKEQIDYNAFSEWSTVMIIKPIDRPDIAIQNAQSIQQDVISTERIESTLTPLFESSYTIDSINNEPLDRYKFDLYSGSEIDNVNLLESSGWVQYNAVENAGISYRFKHVLTNYENYTVIYSIRTINGYEDSAEPYVFMASQAYLDELENVILRVNSTDAYCKENGCIRLYLNTFDLNLSGSYVITRSSEKTNYTIWEDLQYLTYLDQAFNNEIIYTDFTVESGVKYKYAFQEENARGLRTTPLYEYGNNPHYVDFEYSYIYRDGLQLTLKYNQQLNSFKHTTLTTKQDTLGSRYPHLSRNGYAYYAEFPIQGLISFQMDNYQTFFQLQEDGYYYKNELVIPLDKFGDIDEQHRTDLRINTDLTSDNIFVERKFREKVEEFLNDFDYKLYKSSTEGNIIIGLMNISLTPKKELGRMIFDFSGTAYEVLECNISNMDEFGIINIGHFQTLASDDIHISFGQIGGIYTINTPIDVYKSIQQQEEVSVGGGYKLQLKRLRSLWVERYPEQDFSIEITELLAQKSKLENDNEDTSAVDAQIKELENLQQAFAQPLTNIILTINGQRIMVQPHRLYSVKQPITSLEVAYSVYPLILNYVCELTRVEDESVGVISAIDASQIWGQLAGVFTGTDEVLRTYNFNYKPNEPPLQVFNGLPDKTIVKDAKGNIIADNTNFNVFKTVNLYDIIKEDTQRQVELIYKTSGPFVPDENGELTVDNIYYEFSDINSINIEAEPGTELYISNFQDGKNKTLVVVGPTGKYNIKPADGLVRFIALRRPAFAIINYKCFTTQKRYDRQGG